MKRWWISTACMFFPTMIGVIGAFFCFGAAVMQEAFVGHYARERALLEQKGVLTPAVVKEKSPPRGDDYFIVYLLDGVPDEEDNQICEGVSRSDFERFREGQRIHAWILGDKHRIRERTDPDPVETPTLVFVVVGVIFASMPFGGFFLKRVLLRRVSRGREEPGAPQPSAKGKGSREAPGPPTPGTPGIPEEPLRTATTVSNQRSHRLAEGLRGLQLVASRKTLYYGIALFCVYCAAAVLMPSSVWRFLDETAGKAAKYALIVPLVASFGSLIVVYFVSCKFGTRMEFDELRNEVRIRKGRKRDTRRLADLVAVQVCYIRAGTMHRPYFGYQLNLVFRSGDDGYYRVCVMNSGKGSVWGIAKAISERLGVRFMDCATKEHHRAENERFDRTVT